MATGQLRKEREQAAIDAVLAEHKGAHRDSLIPILQHMQDRVGYLSVAAVRSIAHHLHLPASKVYGVATFYNQFRFMPKGKYHVQVCRGTACHVKGSLATLDAVRQELGVEPGETSKNGAYSIEVVACMGACGLAPLVCVNGTFYADMTPKKVRALLEEQRERQAAHEAR